MSPSSVVAHPPCGPVQGTLQPASGTYRFAAIPYAQAPVGPLRFSIGRPLNKGEKDQSELFQFQMGTTF